MSQPNEIPNPNSGDKKGDNDTDPDVEDYRTRYKQSQRSLVHKFLDGVAFGVGKSIVSHPEKIHHFIEWLNDNM